MTLECTTEFVRLRDLCARWSVTKPTIYRWIHTRGFPAPFPLSRRTTVFVVHEIDAWLQAQSSARRVGASNRNSKRTKLAGRPSAAERAEAARLGVTIGELRRRRVGGEAQ